MDKRLANNIVVGILVIIGVIAFIFVLFNISGGKGVFSKEYHLYARFQQVKGLNYGSEVSLSGLRAGTVKKISVESSDTKALVVEMAISTDMQDKIRRDSVASIQTSGVLGDKYIEISIGSASSPMLQDGDYLQIRQTPDLFSKGGALVEDVNRYFKKGSELDILLRHIDEVAVNVAALTSELQTGRGLWYELTRGQSAAHIDHAAEHFDNVMRKIDQGDGSLGALINDPTVYEDLKAIMGGAKRSTILRYFMRSFMSSGKEAESSGK